MDNDTAKITLYQFGNSVCCQKVRITMDHKGLGWDTVEINLFRNEQYAPEYLKLNPKGVVPTIIHNGAVVCESTLICEYLDDCFPNPSLIPADPLARTHMRFWSKLVDEGLHEGVSEISFSAMFRARMQASTPEQREVRFRNIGDPRRRDRFMSSFEHGVRSPFVRHAIAAYERAFGHMEHALAAGGPWLLGDVPSLADVNMMPYVARLAYLGLLDIWTAERPHVRAWWAMVQNWPSFIAGIVQPMSEAEFAEMRVGGARIRAELAEVHAEVCAMIREAELARR